MRDETIMNYLMIGIQQLKAAVLIGIPVYIVIFMLLYALKIRKHISWNCVFEMIFCIYGIFLLKITGIFTLNLSLDGSFSYNLLPFVGSSIIPVLLNFALFVPYGFLLPLVFPSCRCNWKKVVMIGGLTSLAIELFQMFGGRYAEIDDFLINLAGAFSGYILYACGQERKKSPKKAAVSLLYLCLAIVIGFIGIYMVGGDEKHLPDGFSAVEHHIAEINVYANGEKRAVEMDSDVYHCFANQISNCGGHVLETQRISNSEIWNKEDCFLEIIYGSPQTIVFENAEDFSIENASRILFNANQNILYWGNSSYQYCLDFMKLDYELQQHRDEILKGYEQLPTQIIECFKQL